MQQESDHKTTTVYDLAEISAGSSGNDEAKETETSPSLTDVVIQGVALFSDGYNVQIISYMNLIMAKLSVSSTVSREC